MIDETRTTVPPEVRLCSVELDHAVQRLIYSSTYKTSGTDLNRRSSLSNGAVGSCENSVAVQERTTTEVASTANTLDADDEGEVTLGSSGATNDGVLGELSLRELGVLGNGSCGAECGDREGNENVLELHLEEIGGSSLVWRCLKRRWE